jgi:hypothetical protein
MYISMATQNYKEQLSTVFNVSEMNKNNYISIFSLFINTCSTGGTIIKPSDNWYGPHNTEVKGLTREVLGIPDTVNLGITIGGSYITNWCLLGWFNFFNKGDESSTQEFTSMESFVEYRGINYIAFDVEHAWAPKGVTDGVQGMPVDEFDKFIRNFSAYCNTTKGYFRNNSIYFFIAGDTILNANTSGVYSTADLYKSYTEEYTTIRDLLKSANSSKLKGILGIKLLMYCYGANQPDADQIVNGTQTGPSPPNGWINLDNTSIPKEDLPIFYNNFNIVFYATPYNLSYGNNNTYKDQKVMQHISGILDKGNIKKYPQLQYVINNSSPPPFIWTDQDANLQLGQPAIWEETTPNLFDIMNNYCPSQPIQYLYKCDKDSYTCIKSPTGTTKAVCMSTCSAPSLPSKIDNISIKGEQLIINYSPQ